MRGTTLRIEEHSRIERKHERSFPTPTKSLARFYGCTLRRSDWRISPGVPSKSLSTLRRNSRSRQSTGALFSLRRFANFRTRKISVTNEIALGDCLVSNPGSRLDRAKIGALHEVGGPVASVATEFSQSPSKVPSSSALVSSSGVITRGKVSVTQ